MLILRGIAAVTLYKVACPAGDMLREGPASSFQAGSESQAAPEQVWPS